MLTIITHVTGARIDKTERLLNLTLALLATRRPLSKQQIFENVSGYSGVPESMERMFERDKDELRELGVTIEVLPIDPFFEDELGYQILAQDFFLPSVEFSPEETLWLAVATSAISESQHALQANSAFQKLITRGGGQIEEIINSMQMRPFDISINEVLERAWRAIHAAKNLLFSYTTEVETTSREVSPYGIITRFGRWYLVAADIGDSTIKTFRIDRISEIAESRSKFLPTRVGFDLENFTENFRGERLQEVTLRLHADLPSTHRILRTIVDINDSRIYRKGEEVTLFGVDPIEMTEMVLWSSGDVEVLSPLHFREQVAESLQRTLSVNS